MEAVLYGCDVIISGEKRQTLIGVCLLLSAALTYIPHTDHEGFIFHAYFKSFKKTFVSLGSACARRQKHKPAPPCVRVFVPDLKMAAVCSVPCR